MDTHSKTSSDKALEAAMAIGASIYAVDMSATDVGGQRNAQSAGILKSFAEKSGGRFVSTPGGPALRDAFTSIAQELGHQYTISFRPLNQAHDGKWRSLDVKISREGLVVRTRKGYRSPKG
jgi:VWFA-related protein